MMKKSEIIRRLRTKYSYSLKQLYEKFDIHPQTIRSYMKDEARPLAVISKNPILVFSETLKQYFSEDVKSKKVPLAEYEFYCMSCKKKQMPFDNIISKTQINDNVLSLKGLCPICFSMMNKFQSAKGLNNVLPLLKSVSLEKLYIVQSEHNPLKTQNKYKRKNVKKDSLIKFEQEALFALEG